MSCIEESTTLRFFALNKKSAWAEGMACGVEVGEDGIRLAQHLEYVAAKTITRQELGGMVEITDLAIGPCKLLYVLGPLDQGKPAIWTYDSMQDLPLEGVALDLRAPTSIALAPGKLYIANAEGQQRIIALTRPENDLKVVCGPNLGLAQPFTPIDLVTDAIGNLFALDPNNHVIVRFNAEDGKPAVLADPKAALSAIMPAAIAISADGFLYVLDRQGRKVLKFTMSKEPEPPSLIDMQELIRFDQADPLSPGHLPADFLPAGFAVDSEGRVYVGDGRDEPGWPDEDDRFVHKFDANGNYLTFVTGFRGKASLLAIDRASKIYLLTQPRPTEHQRIVALDPTAPKPKRSSVACGSYYSKAFDSTSPGTQWHKLALDATIPANTQLSVAHFVAEEAHSLEEIYDLPDEAWSKPMIFRPQGLNENDKTLGLTALIRQDNTRPVRGRYLWLKLTLTGGEQFTPTVKSVRVYFPRISYLRYLPAVYQQDKAGHDFLERFLSLFETFFANTEQQTDHIAHYFDADAVPDEFVRWLAGWLAIAVDEPWTDQQIRQIRNLIKQAPTLFRQRGTRAGIEELVRIFTGDCPFIVEPFQILSAERSSQIPAPELEELKKILGRLYQSYPDSYSFYVFLRPDQAPLETEREVIRRLVETEKPAHTRAHILNLAPWIILDGHTYLEVNTYLGIPPARLDMGAALGDTRLTALINC